MINLVASVTLPMMMEVSLLGLIETIVPTVAKRTLIGLLLFYACKNFAMHWKKHTVPSLAHWKRLINESLPFYKDTYVNRGCP